MNAVNKLMFQKGRICISYLLLAFSIIICSGFVFWLYRDTDLEKYIDFISESRRLMFYEQYEDDVKLRSEIMDEIYDDEINIIWLPFVQDLPVGYAKLELYLGLLVDNPDHEIIYKDIAGLIDSAPEGFLQKDKTRYLKELTAIEGIHHVLLKRYDLLLTVKN